MSDLKRLLCKFRSNYQDQKITTRYVESTKNSLPSKVYCGRHAACKYPPPSSIWIMKRVKMEKIRITS
ncbi:5948_t:CDS:2 [Funneliformis mosseae]|uniref:5948_t:CDS:1 n=1 Tax=Funneliformis mosseae TaxID=27381 RepID=A0A9N9EIW7_FUNMO|nr:5948_t:CDS:2 [Funneliformis mosseae]